MLKYSNEQLIEAVKTSFSISEVIKKLGTNPSGGLYPRLKKNIRGLHLNTSHFTGQLWSKGKNVLTDKRVFRKHIELFCLQSKVSRCHIKKIILQNNLIKYICSECSIKKWKGKKLSLHLEHKNGDRTDNRLENLTFLCPNCHSLTNTYCKKKNLRNALMS